MIKKFKLHYHQLLLQHTFSQTDGTDLTASSIVKTVNMLMTVSWIKQMWDEIKPQTIINWFKLCGALPQEQESDEDPFAGLEEDDPLVGSDIDHSRLQELVDQLCSGTTALEYTSADDDLCTCMTFEDTDQSRLAQVVRPVWL